MEKKYKTYAKLNLLSLFFVAVSFISITLAWFAYSGLARVETVINVKAWYIKFEGGQPDDSNNITISSSEIYPGMETITEKINIKNLGDSDAEISYSIVEARILDDIITLDEHEPGYLVDKLSQDYPFHLNISLSKNYIDAIDGTGELEVSLSWPLDSDHDELDSTWGNAAYNFQAEEEKKHNDDNTYQKRPAVKIMISVKAEQKISSEELIDAGYNIGDVVLFDIEENKICAGMSDNCIKTYLIDVNQEENNTSVSLLPDLYDTYQSGTYGNYETLSQSVSGNWKVLTRPLIAEDLLKVISNDVVNSNKIRPKKNLSDSLVGYVHYGNRATSIVNDVISYDGYFEFLNAKFPFLATSKCYWLNTEYNETNGFAIKKFDDTYSRIYKELKSNTCSIVPVIVASSLSGNIEET